jgi:hypothetical protein
MEKSEKHRFNHKSKEKVKIKPNNKGDSKKIKDNISQQKDLISQNQSNLTQIKNILPIQDPSSLNQNQNQNQGMIYAYPVIIINQGEGVPQTCINNQNKDSKIKVGIKPEEIICPYCHQKVLTVIDDKCNCCSFISYMIMIIIFPIFYLYLLCVNIEECRCELGCEAGNDGCCCVPTCCKCPSRNNLDGCLCCCDVNHYCPSCRNLIGTRDACLDVCPPYCYCCCN